MLIYVRGADSDESLPSDPTPPTAPLEEVEAANAAHDMSCAAWNDRSVLIMSTEPSSSHLQLIGPLKPRGAGRGFRAAAQR